MSISYSKLWKLLIDNNLKRTDLIRLAGISSNIVSKMGKNEYVAMESLEKICRTLNCDVGDIVSITSTSAKATKEEIV